MNPLFTNAKVWRRLLAAVVAAAALSGAQPWIWRYVESGAQDIHNRRTEEQQLAELTERLRVIEQKHTDQAALLDGLATIFPHADSTSQVVDRLEQLADKQSVELAIKTIGPPATAAGAKPSVLSPIVVSVEVKGSATRLLQYIDGVEHVPELATVQSWDISPFTPPASASPAPPPSPSFVLAINILFYLQP